ncbi:methyltransferase domain-containing protein [Amaricoccus sp.]|uniref:class I SAM-dependent methyltransferase n=1 Tax=Amaricoccus sp. TaxID=1872485 RepID=UPI001B6FC07E|nr:methyltransferase domain-containing protein [Amaricoccus sp.]MBP7242851.1 methyltransferase domain-containing protein [Amaricoccus sp.]
MHLDVLDLRAFYYRTKLGRTAQRGLQDALRGLWPETRAMTVVGFGFAAPMLRPFLADARRVVALMPEQQGVMHWPVGAPNVSALVEETRWPVETGSVDRLIVAHGLETCERPDALLAEIWRVLAPQGQAVFIVPNRSGLWARREGTPFGFGRPYTFGQVEAILGRHGLVAGRHAAALYAPPSHRRFWLQTAHLWERLGRRFDPHLVAGALLVEATKQIYARPRTGAKAAILGPLGALEGLSRPAPEPVRGRAPVAARIPRREA